MNKFKVSINLDLIKEKKRNEINLAKAAAEVRGVPYYFNGERDFIQLRDDRDRNNITSLVTQALILKSAQVTDPVIGFMPESNTLRMMTPDEVIQMGSDVMTFGSGLYAKAWDLKARIAAATTVEEIEAIQWDEEGF